MLNKTIKKMAREAAKAYRRETTRELRNEAKRKMQEPLTCATSLLIAAKHLLGEECFEFEPETLWLELDPPLVNRDKLLAAISLIKYPSYYWDHRVFGSTALAFSHNSVFPEETPEPSPDELAWSVYEAELIFALTDPDHTVPHFDDTIATYAAAILHHEGLVACPDALSFCDEELVRLACRDSECEHLHDEAKKAWRELNKDDLEERKFDDTALGVQLSRQAEIHLYLINRAKDMASCLARF